MSKHEAASPSPTVTVTAAALTALGVGGIDYVSPTEYGFFVFYFLPVTAVAWRVGLKAGLGVALFSTLVWFSVEALSPHVYPNWVLVMAWNGVIRCIAFILVAVSVALAGRALRREQVLNRELQAALKSIQQLEGLLPICASCKSIRNDGGYWERIEAYLSAHADVAFSHGICPECLRKLYPDVADRVLARTGDRQHHPARPEPSEER